MGTRRNRLTGVCLATALILTCPLPGQAQDDQSELSLVELGLVGLTVDLPDGQDLGRGCHWYDSSSGGAVRGCRLTLAWLSEAGVPVIEEANIDFSTVAFGNERFQVAGRITSIAFEGSRTSVFSGSHTVKPQREVYTDYDGNIVGRSPARSNDLWGRAQVRSPEVRVLVEWSLYDRTTSAVVSEREEKGAYTYRSGTMRRQTMIGVADATGAAIFDSLEEFVDRVSDDMD